MKYKLVPSEKYSSNRKTVYFFPASPDPENYFKVCPEYGPEDILNGNITVRAFDECLPEAIDNFRDQLAGELDALVRKKKERQNSLITTGIVCLILGVVSWFVPDPIPVVDELLFTLGGIFIIWRLWGGRKSSSTDLADRVYRYSSDKTPVPLFYDNTLTLLYRAIRCKVYPSEEKGIIDKLDSIEKETLWLTKYLNRQDIASENSYSPEDIREILDILGQVLPLKKIDRLSGRGNAEKKNGRIRRIRETVYKNTGLTSELLTVYLEFYRLFKEDTDKY